MFIPELIEGIKLNIKINGENNSYSLLFIYNNINLDFSKYYNEYRIISLKSNTISNEELLYLYNTYNIDKIFLINLDNNITNDSIKNRVVLINTSGSFFNSSLYSLNYYNLNEIIDNEINLDILYEDNHVIVIDKPCGISSQKDVSIELDILTLYKDYLVWRYKKSGNAYLGLVQRLDKNVSGVMILSKSTKAHTRLNSCKPKKAYLAVCYEELEKREDTINLKLSKDEKNHMAYLDNINGKDSITHYQVIDYKDNLSLVKVIIDTGRFHQIRFTMSYLRHPIYNDKKYNNKIERTSYDLGLDCYHISFIHPITKEEIVIERIPKRGVFNLFCIKNDLL